MEGFHKRKFHKKKYIAVDGYIQQGASVGNGGLMSMVMGAMSADEGPQIWIPCQKWIEKDSIKEISFEKHDITLKVEKKQPRPQRVEEGQANQEEEKKEEEDEIMIAPSGWWIKSGITKVINYHVEDMEEGQELTQMEETNPIADAIIRLADEIALKPTSIPGSEMMLAKEHFEKLK